MMMMDADRNPTELLQLALQNAQSLGGSLPSGLPGGMALDPATKHARKIYVGNLPMAVTEDSLKQFFNEALDSLLPSKVPGAAVVGCYLNLQRRFAFLEHRSIEEANFTLGLDGIQYAGHALKLRRPQDYNPQLAEAQQKLGTGVGVGVGAAVGISIEQPMAPPTIPQGDLVAGALGIISTTVDDSPNKVFIGGLPHHLTETEVKTILSAFGPLKSFHLVKAQPTIPGEAEKSKGFAFCEWRDGSITDTACASLNGMKIGDRILNVRRAVPHAVHKASTLGVSPQQIAAMGLAPSAPSIPGLMPGLMMPPGLMPGITSGVMSGVMPVSPPPATSSIGRISRVVSIRNMLPSVVSDPSVIDDVLAEAELECGVVGTVRGAHWVPSNQTILVEFSSTKEAVKALNHLQGKSFDGRVLGCSFSDATPEMRVVAVQRIVDEANRLYEKILLGELNGLLPSNTDVPSIRNPDEADEENMNMADD